MQLWPAACVVARALCLVRLATLAQLRGLGCQVSRYALTPSVLLLANSLVGQAEMHQKRHKSVRPPALPDIPSCGGFCGAVFSCSIAICFVYVCGQLVPDHMQVAN